MAWNAKSKWKPSPLIIVFMILQGLWVILLSPFVLFDMYGTAASDLSTTVRSTLQDVAIYAWLLVGLASSISILARRVWGWWLELVFLLPFAAEGIEGLASGSDPVSTIPIALFGLAAPTYVLWLAVRMHARKDELS